jgi:hypothetical protein
VDNSYPHSFYAFRSHDGAHNDAQFMHNITWANGAVEAGKLWGYIVYYFYRPGFDGAASLKARVGKQARELALVAAVARVSVGAGTADVRAKLAQVGDEPASCFQATAGCAQKCRLF